MLNRIKNLLHLREKTVELNPSEKIDNLFDSLHEDTIKISLGTDLSEFVDLFCEIIQELREEIKSECGFIIPEVIIKQNDTLQENEFEMFIKNKQSGCGFLIPNENGIREEFYEIFKTSFYANIDDIFTNEIAERYITAAQEKNQYLIWNISCVLSIVEIKRILSEIINHGKSINNIGYVFEKIGEEIFLNGDRRSCCKEYNLRDIAQKVAGVL